MRKYGTVDTCFWTDGKIRTLSEKGKFLFLYLLTCQHSNAIGCYRLPLAYISSDLKWTPETVTQTVTQTVSIGLIEYDFDREIVWLKNFFKHNTIDNPNVAKGCISHIEVLDKDSPIFPSFIKSLIIFSERFPKGYINGLCNGLANPLPNGMPNIDPNLTYPEPILMLDLEVSQKSKFDDFWKLFPKQRAGSREKGEAAYAKALKRDTEENIFHGLKNYTASAEVKKGFAKGCAAWLNDDRWKTDYQPSEVTKSGWNDNLD